MDDEDIILMLYAAPGGWYEKTVGSIYENADRVGALVEKPEQPARELDEESDDGHTATRETTAEPEGLGGAYPITFSHGARTSFGFILGTDPRCDFAIEKTGTIRISSFHLAFQFDSDYRLVVKDLASVNGTSVVYDGNDIGRRVATSWLLGGCQYTEKTKTILIQVANSLQFLVEVPSRDTLSPTYRSKVDRFRQGTDTDPEALLKALQLHSQAATQRASNVRTPSQWRHPPIYRKEVGKGGFGTVTHVWNAQTGEESAVKTPLTDQQYNKREWEKEAEIMGQVVHYRQPHIVDFFGAEYSPLPTLSFEFVWGGSLHSHLSRPGGFTRFETVQVLRQATDVLMYLHSESVQITHRDISPRNILVSSRNHKGIFIKFADFGLAREGEQLITACGNPPYMAPEIQHRWSKVYGAAGTYTPSVDIWSTGVVIAEMLCGLPERRNQDCLASTWHDKIRNQVSRYYSNTRDSLARFLLDSMLPIDPSKRASAAVCHEDALRLPDGSKESRGPQGSYPHSTSGAELSTVRPAAQQMTESNIRPSIEVPIISLSSRAEESLDRYIVGHQPPSSPGSTASSTQRQHRQAEASRLVQNLHNPEHSLYSGSSILEDLDPQRGLSPSSMLDDSADDSKTTSSTKSARYGNSLEPEDFDYTNDVNAQLATEVQQRALSGYSGYSSPGKFLDAVNGVPLPTDSEAALEASLLRELMAKSEQFSTGEVSRIWDAEQERQSGKFLPQVQVLSEFPASGRKRSIGEPRSGHKRSKSCTK